MFVVSKLPIYGHRKIKCLACEELRKSLGGDDWHSGEKIMNGTSAAVNHAEKEHSSLLQVAEWLRKAAMKKQAKKDKAAAAAASLTNDMKSSGLDGWVRTVSAGDARPSSVSGGMPQWKFSSPQHQRLTRACCDFLVLDGQPVSAIEVEHICNKLTFQICIGKLKKNKNQCFMTMLFVKQIGMMLKQTFPVMAHLQKYFVLILYILCL